MNHRPGYAWFLAACCALVLHGGTARADTVKTKNVTHKDVKIIGLREGKLHYKTASGDENSKLLEEIVKLEIDKYPEMSKADEAFDKEDYAGAVKLLQPLVDTKAKEDYVKVLAGAKLVAALDRSGQYEAAAVRYAKLLALDNSSLTQSAKPESFPAEAAERQKIAAKLGEVLKTTTDPLAKDYLTKAVAQLKSGEVRVNPLAPKSNLLKRSEEAQRDPLDDAIAGGKAEAALAAIDKELADEDGGAPARLLYYRGLAQAKLGKEGEALISYMRVAILFPTSDYYTKSLVAAGKIRAKQGKAQQARKLWTEAKDTFDDDDPQAKEVEQLLAGLEK